MTRNRGVGLGQRRQGTGGQITPTTNPGPSGSRSAQASEGPTTPSSTSPENTSPGTPRSTESRPAEDSSTAESLKVRTDSHGAHHSNRLDAFLVKAVEARGQIDHVLDMLFCVRSDLGYGPSLVPTICYNSIIRLRRLLLTARNLLGTEVDGSPAHPAILEGRAELRAQREVVALWETLRESWFMPYTAMARYAPWIVPIFVHGRYFDVDVAGRWVHWEEEGVELGFQLESIPWEGRPEDQDECTCRRCQALAKAGQTDDAFPKGPRKKPARLSEQNLQDHTPTSDKEDSGVSGWVEDVQKAGAPEPQGPESDERPPNEDPPGLGP